ncbi:MAG: sugar ABC transporter permease [Caldilineaceae bacterium]|nr:sugar ABC transporter permease [Caldilineaceae bacterium]
MPSRNVLQEWIEGYAFASPFIIGFVAFIAFPMIYSIWLSFQRWNLLGDPQFIGLANITRVFTNERANLSLWNSAYYTVFAVPLQLIISFALALALTQAIRFRDFYRSGFYLPIIIPLVAWSVVWQRVLHPEFGILNEMLGWIGIAPQPWLFDPSLSKPAFIFMSLWMIGRQMVIFIAGLTSIPPALLEAASIDGANGFRRIWSVVLPLMTPFIFYNMVIAIVNSFQSFVPAAIMTSGGPENSTLFAVLYIWRQGFQFFNMGYASTLAWEFFIIVVGFTVAQFVISRRWVYYEN